MSGNIFINYRRGDEPGFTQALLGRLEQSFPAERLFIDVDHIPPGEDFVRVLEAQVAKCDALLAVIGRGWLEAADDSGHRRLDDPNDFVRVEIESALKLGKRVIPVLVHDARMPRADELPEAIRPLATRNAVRLTHERFRSDVQGLVAALQRGSNEAATPGPTAAVRVAPPWSRGLRAGLTALGLAMAIAAGIWLLRPHYASLPATTVSQAPMPVPSTPAPAQTTAPTPALPAAVPATPTPPPSAAALPARAPQPRGPTEECATLSRPGDAEQYCASSVLAPEAGNTYGVENLFSANEATAWVHGTHKTGVGQWIVVDFAALRSVKSVTIRNGYEKNADTYKQNSRVRQMRLVFSQGESKLVALEDRLGDQSIFLDQPVRAYWIQFLIEDVFSGSKYPDTAISKLFVASDPAQEHGD